jgi:hypothetical protein
MPMIFLGEKTAPENDVNKVRKDIAVEFLNFGQIGEAKGWTAFFCP